MSEWISVKDSLPSENEIVLFVVNINSEIWTGNPKQLNVGFYTKDYGWKLTSFLSECLIGASPDIESYSGFIQATHWQPLPIFPDDET